MCDAAVQLGFPQDAYRDVILDNGPHFANQSCDPFYPKNARCVVGSYVQYAVNAQESCRGLGSTRVQQHP